mmetsp:Transcript_23766/g.34920  ORF Transcript_23766/g.34920 Transcript_23766/m.34920 type:complete len:117 (-) Transcript_23766:2137-2487(-)
MHFSFITTCTKQRPLSPLTNSVSGSVKHGQDGKMKIHWTDTNIKQQVGKAEIIVMRGIPGSGKSSIANFLSRNGDTSTVVSADSYFEKHHDGVFCTSSLGSAHAFCKGEFSYALKL